MRRTYQHLLIIICLLSPFTLLAQVGEPVAITVEMGNKEMTYDINDIHMTSDNHDLGCKGFAESDEGITAHGVSLKSMVQQAYDVCGKQIIGLPTWDQTTRFDIAFRMAEPVSTAFSQFSEGDKRLQRRYMLQLVLLERFNLRAHPGSANVYELTPLDISYPAASLSFKLPRPVDSELIGKQSHLKAENITPSQLASELGVRLACIVIDRTSTTEHFNIDLAMPATPVAGASVESVEMISLSLRDEVGLNLLAKGQSETVFVDQVQLPVPNGAADPSTK